MRSLTKYCPSYSTLLLGILTTGLMVFFALFALLSFFSVIYSVDLDGSAEDNLSKIPEPLHGVARVLAPEMFVVPSRKSVGTLLSISYSNGFSHIETHAGYFVVSGAVSAIKGSEVFLSGLEQKNLKDRLCLDDRQLDCYRLLDSSSL